MRVIPRLSIRRTEGVSLSLRRLRAAIQGLSSVLRSVFSVLTRLGWAVLICTLVSAVVAWRWGWIEAGVLALMGALSLLVGVFALIGQRHVKVTLRIPQLRTVAGLYVTGEVHAMSKRRRSSATVVEIPVGDVQGRLVIPALRAQDQWSQRFAIATPHRGVIRVGPAQMVRSDILGLFRRVSGFTENFDVIAHPVTVRLPFDSIGFHTDIEGVTTAKLSSSDVSFHALRDYVPGDDRRNVHWPTSARLGKLVVRQFEETRKSHHLLLLDTDASHWDPQAFEIAVSTACSLLRSSIQNSRMVTMMTSTHPMKTSSVVTMLDHAAEVTTTKVNQSLPSRVSELMGRHPGVSAFTLVTSGRTSTEDFRRILQWIGPDVICHIVVVDPGSESARSRVGTARMIHVAALEDLAYVMGVGR